MNTRICSILLSTLLLASAVGFCQTDSSQAPAAGLASYLQLFASEGPYLQDIGKSLVMGRLEKIEGTKITISHSDGVQQSVVVQEKTKFLDARGEAVTMADFVIGEQVAGIGTLESGAFVAFQFCKVPPELGAIPPPRKLPR